MLPLYFNFILIHVINAINTMPKRLNTMVLWVKIYFSISKTCAIICAMREGMHMSDILLKRDSSLAATYVPNTFIDEYMTHADGEFVKIYLYLLRCINSPNTPFSISEIADKFDYTEKDVKRALKYWEKMHLLRLQFNQKNELAEICLTDASKGACARMAQNGTNGILESVAADNIISYSYTVEPSNESKCATLSVAPAPCSESGHGPSACQADENVKELLYVAERYLGRQLTITEADTILYWMDKFGFSQDLIDYLIEQCVAKEHTSIQYMDKIALSWAKQGIRTLSEAQKGVETYRTTIYAVKKAFGISSRSLADFEQEFVRTWAGEMGYSDEVIALACQKTLKCTQKINFNYANSILENWKEQNVHTLAEIELLDAKHQKMQTKKYAAAKKAAVQASLQASVRTSKTAAINNYNHYSQRAYDYEALERELLTR